MLNLNQLRIFQAVSQTRSFTRAAELVHLTQPGISKHIKQMEEHFGVPLLDRTGKKVVLTQAGEVLSEATQEIMATIAGAERKIEELKGLRGGKLVLGSSSPVGIYVLPRILAAFRKQYPAVDVTLDISLSERIETKIIGNKLELGLVTHQTYDPKLFAGEFLRDELVAIAPKGHRWAAKPAIRPQDLLGETLIMATRGAGTRAVVEERLKAKGITLKKVVDFGNTEGVKRAVEMGLGISIQSRIVVEREIAAGSLVAIPLAGMDNTLVYYYLRRNDRHLSNPAKAFLELLQTKMAK